MLKILRKTFQHVDLKTFYVDNLIFYLINTNIITLSFILKYIRAV